MLVPSEARETGMEGRGTAGIEAGIGPGDGPGDGPGSGEVVDLAARRAAREAEERRRREDAFDRELGRRLAAFLDGRPIPSTPIPDNPYA